jgi:regulator of protease activity HflC (stomatin/prohibitin superfamily)
MRSTTTHRHDFTEEERLAYNKYMVARMQEFRKTDHGREIVNANNRKAYQKRRAKLLEERAKLLEEREKQKIEIII